MINLKGILIPVNWDHKGNIVALALATGDEEVYWIENRGPDEALLRLLREEVEVTGILKSRGPKKTIEIIDFI